MAGMHDRPKQMYAPNRSGGSFSGNAFFSDNLLTLYLGTGFTLES